MWVMLGCGTTASAHASPWVRSFGSASISGHRTSKPALNGWENCRPVSGGVFADRLLFWQAVQSSRAGVNAATLATQAACSRRPHMRTYLWSGQEGGRRRLPSSRRPHSRRSRAPDHVRLNDATRRLEDRTRCRESTRCGMNAGVPSNEPLRPTSGAGATLVKRPWLLAAERMLGGNVGPMSKKHFHAGWQSVSLGVSRAAARTPA